MPIVSLYLILFLAIFNFTSSIMGGMYIVSDLGGSIEISGYNVTCFGLGNALSFPLSTYLKNRFGALYILRLTLVLFLATLLLCGSSPTFFLFLLWRLLSGLVSGVFFPLSLSLITPKIAPNKQEWHHAFLAFFITVTPVLGACFGGWIAYDFLWRDIFFLQIPLPLWCLYALRKETNTPCTAPLPPLDRTGYYTYAISCLSGVLAICLGQELDWLRSPLLCALLTIAIVFGLFFLLWEKEQPNPLLDLSLCRIFPFSLGCILVFFLFSAYFGMIILLSQWLHLEAHYTPWWISLLLLHMLLAGILLSIFVYKWMRTINPLYVVLLALLFFATSCFYSATFNAETNFGKLAIARIFAGFGLAFFLFPLLSLCTTCVPKEKKEAALSLFQSIRLLGGALGVSVYTTLWYRRKVFYHDRLGSSLTLFSENTKQFFQDLSFIHIPAPDNLPLLEQALTKQATALALADSFYCMGFVMLSLIPPLWGYLLWKARQPSL